MAHYTFIAPDGTRTKVEYDPHHDGPVSERQTALNKLRWLQKWCRKRPGDIESSKKLSLLQRQYNQKFLRSRSGHRRHTDRVHTHAPVGASGTNPDQAGAKNPAAKTHTAAGLLRSNNLRSMNTISTPDTASPGATALVHGLTA